MMPLRGCVIAAAEDDFQIWLARSQPLGILFVAAVAHCDYCWAEENEKGGKQPETTMLLYL